MINSYDFYITPEEYEIAAQNGIPRKQVERRIRKYGWDKKRAINTPIRKRTKYSRWLPIVRENGIPEATFRTRVKKGKWDIERAATEPVIVVQIRNRKYSDEVYRALERNGISRQMFYRRISQGWALERAMTEKPYTTEERTKKARKAIKNNRFRELNRNSYVLANAIKSKSTNKKEC